MISLVHLAESPTNPRKYFDSAQLSELAGSIREHGVLEPLIVRAEPNGKETTHQIVCGARRYRAAGMAGLTVVPAVIREFTDDEVRLIQLAENGARADLSPLEEAEAYATFDGWEPTRIAKALGKKPRDVARRLPLARLPKKVKDAMSAGHLPVGHAELIGIIPDPKMQEMALGRMLYTAHAGEKTTIGAQPYAVAKRIVEEEFMTALSLAVFDPEDAELSPLGPCSKCPHLSGNNPDLFGEVTGKGVCTNPKDFQLKTENHLKRLRDKGYTVLLSPNQLKRAFPFGGGSMELGKEFVDLEAVCSDDPKRRSYEILLGKAERLKTVFALKNGRVRKLYPAKDIRTALIASGHAFAKEKGKRKENGKSAAARSAAQLERIGDEAVAHELAAKLRTVKLTPAGWIDLVLRIVLLSEGWRVKTVVGRHGYEGSEKDFALNREKILKDRVEAMSDAEKRAFLVDLLVGDWFHAADKAEAELYRQLLKLASIDYARVANAAIDEAKRKAVDSKRAPKPPIAAKTVRLRHPAKVAGG